MRRLTAIALVAGLAGCGGGGKTQTKTQTVRTQTTKVQVVQDDVGGATGASFSPEAIYRREAPGVVTILSVNGGNLSDGGLGSGFLLNGKGEIATNAHVVTQGERSAIKKVDQVFVEFSDGNRVPGTIEGFDPDADVALVKIDPAGLALHPLPLGNSGAVKVGEPVAAIGSPFGERQSLSVGIVSAVDRDVQSLTKYRISGAIQTDAAINPGNSGGPLVDRDGRVIGLNQQIESQSGGGEGVGFAVPIDLAKRSLTQLRAKGRVDYALIGVSTQPVYPQLAQRFHLATKRGAWIQTITSDGPADDAGLRAGSGPGKNFQAEVVQDGGDVIVKVGSFDIANSNDLADAIARLDPGDTVPVVVYRGSERKTVRVKLDKRSDVEDADGG